MLKNNIIISIYVILAALLQGCIGPKSYCFLNTESGKIYLTDTSRISLISISSENYSFKEQLDSNSYVIDLKKISSKGTIISIKTTDFRQRYLLKLDSNDLVHKDKLKFRSLVR
jgi:hypothetical protein